VTKPLIYSLYNSGNTRIGLTNPSFVTSVALQGNNVPGDTLEIYGEF